MNPALFLLHLTGGRFGYIVVCVLLGTWLQAAEKPVIRGKPIKPVNSTSKEATRNTIATNAVARPADISTTNSALTVVGFELLSAFKYEVPEEGSAGTVPKPTAVPAVDPDGQIPAKVKAFNGRRVALKGFMLPLKVEGGLVTELLLMRDQSMCCFGTVPKINEWVAVKMTGTGRCLGRAVVGRVLDREKKRRERGRGAVRIGVRAVLDRIGEVSCAVSAGLFPIFWRLRSCFQHFHAGHG